MRRSATSGGRRGTARTDKSACLIGGKAAAAIAGGWSAIVRLVAAIALAAGAWLAFRHPRGLRANGYGQ